MLKMKFGVVLLAFLSATAVTGRPDDEELDEEFYRKIFDDVDTDSIIDNDRVLDFYLKCFFDEGPCSDLADAIKSKFEFVSFFSVILSPG